jgi:hypothetical protein
MATINVETIFFISRRIGLIIGAKIYIKVDKKHKLLKKNTKHPQFLIDIGVPNLV